MKRWNDDEFEFSGAGGDDEWMEFAHQMDDEMIVPEEDVYYEKLSELRLIELGIAERHQRAQILARAVRLAKASWLWYILPMKYKLRRIQQIFDAFVNLIERNV